MLAAALWRCRCRSYPGTLLSSHVPLWRRCAWHPATLARQSPRPAPRKGFLPALASPALRSGSMTATALSGAPRASGAPRRDRGSRNGRHMQARASLPTVSAKASQEHLTALVGRPTDRSAQGHILVTGPKLSCLSTAPAGASERVPGARRLVSGILAAGWLRTATRFGGIGIGNDTSAETRRRAVFSSPNLTEFGCA
jgi:hypothetical protein